MRHQLLSRHRSPDMAPSLYRQCCIFVSCFGALLAAVEGGILVSPTEKLQLIESTGDILCSFHTKTIHVYFENMTSMGYSSEVLRKLNGCGISIISMRNRLKTSPLERITDDGILMYLLMILHDASQHIELSILHKKSAAKHLSHVLMVIADASTVTESWLRSTFEKFWQIWFLNIAIMFWRDNRLQVYRYDPFTQHLLIKVAYGGALPQLAELFPKTMPNMRGRPLRICMYHDEIRAIFKDGGRIDGPDGLMSAYVAERLNATPIVDQASSYGNFILKADICFREVAKELDDIAMNTRFLALPTFIKHVESTIVHSRDDLCVLVPKAKTASTFWNLFRSFEGTVWLPILLSIPLAYGFCAVLYRRLCLSEIVLLQLFASTLSMPLTQIPSRISLRIFLFCWLLYGMLICNAYKGNLTSNLLFRTYLKDINSIKDLAESPYDLLMFTRHTKHLNRFLNISQPHEAHIKQKMTIVPDEVLHTLIESNNVSYAYLQKYHVATFHANSRRHSSVGRPLYHVMSTCLVPFHAVFIVPYGSPYLGFINSLVRSSQEFGFNIYWERKTNAVFRKWGRNDERRQKNDDDPVVLKLPHLQAAFCLLALGLSFAFIAFLYELFKKQNLVTMLGKV